MKMKAFSFLLITTLFIAYNLQTFSATEKEFKGKTSKSYLNDGNEFDIHWYVDKEKNVSVTSFTDNINEAVIVIEGKHTIDFPVLFTNKDANEGIVYCEKVTITLDKDNKIINIENRGSIEIDTIEL